MTPAMANGTRFALGSGFTDAQRSRPPSIGSTITLLPGTHRGRRAALSDVCAGSQRPGPIRAVLTKTKVPSLTVHEVSLDPRLIERTKRTVERVWQAIQAGHFYPNPSPMNCSACSYPRAL